MCGFGIPFSHCKLLTLLYSCCINSFRLLLSSTQKVCRKAIRIKSSAHATFVMLSNITDSSFAVSGLQFSVKKGKYMQKLITAQWEGEFCGNVYFTLCMIESLGSQNHQTRIIRQFHLINQFKLVPEDNLWYILARRELGK